MEKGVDSLISPFVFWSTHSERFLTKTHALRESHRHPQTWLWGDQWRWLQNVKRAGLPPNVSNNKSIIHCTDDGQHQSFGLPLNPLGHVERLWDLCCIGTTEQKFTLFPHREETLWITVCPLRRRLSAVWFSWLPAMHLVFESECTGGKRGLPRTSYGC